MRPFFVVLGNKPDKLNFMFSVKNIFGHYWSEAKKHRFFCIAAFISFGIAILTTSILLPLLYREIIDIIVETEEPAKVVDELFRIVAAIALFIIGSNIFFRVGDYSLIRFQTRSMRDITNYVFRKMERHSYSFFADQFVGSITAKVRRFIYAFDRIVDTTLFRFTFSFLRITGILVVFFFIEPLFGWLFLSWIIIYAIVIGLRARPQIKYDLEEARTDSSVTGIFADVLGSIMAVKMFSAEGRERRRFEIETEKQEEKRMRTWSYATISIGIQGLLLGILEIVAIWLAVTLWVEGSISTGTIVLVQSYILVIFSSLLSIGQHIVRFFQDLTRAQEMVDILDLDKGVKDPKNPESLSVSEGRIEFENVSFTYEEDNEHILDNFSLTIRPGEKVGIVGPSGAGKSTITKILLRFIDIKGGSIKIDGYEIRNVKQQDLRNNIAYVPQDAIMFHRTIRENITYAKPDASDEEIFRVAEKARIHNFILSLPQGYDTLVGERGVKLSGGERQRIAIARAMLKDAPLLLLDEATSSLDTVSEVAIKEALHELMKKKTTLIIAHRLSTVKELDRIVVLDNGKIIEEGFHSQLIQNCGLYATLWSHQSGDW